jgi:hypothetical protein
MQHRHTIDPNDAPESSRDMIAVMAVVVLIKASPLIAVPAISILNAAATDDAGTAPVPKGC